MAILGGTIKIVQEETEVDDLALETIVPVLFSHAQEARLVFGVSAYGKMHIADSLLHETKKSLMSRGLNVRYVEAKHDQILGSVVITKQHLVELVVVCVEGRYIIGITQAVQDFEDWNKRDFARPAPDAHHGMLPPKVARMISNIALSKKDGVLLDPFCGVGTVLSEGLMTGKTVIGFDLSDRAVERARKNVAWLRAEYGLLQTKDARIETGDATHISDVLPPLSVDAIATEPFLGDPSLNKDGAVIPADRVKNIIKGLEKLYIGCLKDWAKVIRVGGRIVVAFPAYAVGGRVLSVKKVVDRCEGLGYTLLTGPIEYSRPQAVVRREFYIFTKN
jgi:tRNA G10  N-methylase Trm11